MNDSKKKYKEIKENTDTPDAKASVLTDEAVEQICGGRLSLEREEHGGDDGSYLHGLYANISNLKNGN